jgi:TolB protein
MMTTRTCLVVLLALVLAVSGRMYPDEVVATPLPAPGAQAGAAGQVPAAPAGQAPDAPRQQSELELTLVNPGTSQRIGLPDFVVPAGDAELSAAAKTIADVLWDDINFEREFYLISRQVSARIPVADAAALPFDRWAELGADYVLVGSARRSGEQIVVQLRMITVRGDSRGRQRFGREYPNCRADRLRYCAHAIADDFHKEVAGLDGIARTRIAFTSDRDAVRVTSRPSHTQGVATEVYLSDYDGANPQRLTVNRGLNILPVWSPDGAKVAYSSYALTGFPDIFVANLREPGRGLRRPAQGGQYISNWMGAYSPDGSQIAFVSNRSGDHEIWVVNSDGTGTARNLTNYPRAAEGAPSWSPDGSFIAFTSDRATGGQPQLYVMNANGTGQRRLSDQRIDRPTWSRLNFIAFTVGPEYAQNIGLLDMNNSGAGVTVLTDSRGTNESPAISPNGRHIAFVTSRWGRQQIAVVDRDGRNIRQITRTGTNRFPNWQPITNR